MSDSNGSKTYCVDMNSAEECGLVSNAVQEQNDRGYESRSTQAEGQNKFASGNDTVAELVSNELSMEGCGTSNLAPESPSFIAGLCGAVAKALLYIPRKIWSFGKSIAQALVSICGPSQGRGVRGRTIDNSDDDEYDSASEAGSERESEGGVEVTAEEVRDTRARSRRSQQRERLQRNTAIGHQHEAATRDTLSQASGQTHEASTRPAGAIPKYETAPAEALCASRIDVTERVEHSSPEQHDGALSGSFVGVWANALEQANAERQRVGNEMYESTGDAVAV